jgi:branched-subunit amino acid aminotransferase/4-amino-4-deoxychorismate lyase
MIPNEATTTDELWWLSPAVRQQIDSDPAPYLRSHGVNLAPGTPRPIVLEVLRITHLLWVEGRIIPKDRFHIDPMDEGLLFARGVWESTRTLQGEPWLWNLHTARLLKTAAECDIPLSPERVPSAKQVKDYVTAITTQDVVVRLNVTAGHHGANGMVWMSVGLRPLPQKSIRMATLQNPAPKGLPYLYGKTFQYATRLKMGQEASKRGFETSLLYDAEGFITESAHANVFLKIGGRWLTPALDGGFLAGTVREHILKNAPLKIEEAQIPVTNMVQVQEAFVTNSNVGLVPVAQIDETVLPVGEDTKALSAWLTPTTPSTSNFVSVVSPS